MSKKFVAIEIEKLQRIAEYYQFPFVVFLAPLTVLERRKASLLETREASILEKNKSFEKEVKELCEKYWGEK